MLKALRHYEDPQSQMDGAEVMTMAIVAALFFGGNLVRDRIPRNIQNNGKQRDVEAMPDAEYRQVLLEKLVEEAQEQNAAALNSD
jgi:hypothetical protein